MWIVVTGLGRGLHKAIVAPKPLGNPARVSAALAGTGRVDFTAIV